MSTLADMWNSFAGVTPFDDLKPLEKLTNCNSGVAGLDASALRSPDSVEIAAR